MLEQRIQDRAFIGLIQKWLKAGILEEDGKIVFPVTGTPQGGVGEYLSSLCPGFVVRKGHNAPMRWGCHADAVCRRLCLLFLISPGPAEVWADDRRSPW
jgi:RNA-directed DNA polymerase